MVVFFSGLTRHVHNWGRPLSDFCSLKITFVATYEKTDAATQEKTDGATYEKIDGATWEKNDSDTQE